MSARPQSPSREIAKLSNNTLTVTSENDERKKLISEYLNKYATISGRIITPQLMEIFEESLSDLSVSRLRAGFKLYLQEGDRFPWPSQIRDLAEL